MKAVIVGPGALLIALLLASPIEAGERSEYSDLIKATEHFIVWSIGGKTPSDRKTKGEAAKACRALQRLSGDSDLLSGLRGVEELSRRHAGERQKLATDVILFRRTFLVPERQILESAGLTHATAGRILSMAARHQSSIDDPFDAGSASRVLRDLEDQLCAGVPPQRVDEMARRLAGVLMLGLDLEYGETGPADPLPWSYSVILGIAMARGVGAPGSKRL